MGKTLRALVVALAMAVAFGGVAAAQVVVDDTGAKVHFKAGANYYQTGAYADALREFQRAYSLSPRPELFINISLCYQQLGDFDSAISYLNKFIEARPDAPNRSDIEQRIANLKQIKDQRDAVILPAPGTEKTNPSTPSTADSLPEMPDVSSDPLVRSAPAPEASEGGGIPTASLVSFIAGGAGLVAFATFGILAMGEDSSLADGCGKDKSCTDDDVSALKTDALLADIGLGVAVVGAGLGVLFWVLDDSGEKAPESKGVAVTPVLSPSTAGVALSGRF